MERQQISDKNQPSHAASRQRKGVFRCGLAALVGRTNVGKSTILNALIGSKVTIVSPKPQTTRENIHGIVNREGGQIVFVDTPGFYDAGGFKLAQQLHEKAREALRDVDVIIHVADPSRAIGREDQMILDALASLSPQKKILCLNKCDLPNRPHADAWWRMAANYRTVLDVSGLQRINLEALVQAVICCLPEGPALYPDGQITNASREFLVGEIIREKIYLLTAQEVPYKTAVEVGSIEVKQDKQGRPMTVVKASIITCSDHYQRMLIGAGGRKIRELGTAARQELETLFGQKVFLDMDVVVDRTLFA